MFECKVLVTGGSGLLGRQNMSVLSGAGVSCHGLCFSRPGEQLTSLDLTDFPASKKFIVDYKPSHVIHTAAQVREVYNKCYNMIKAFLVGISVSMINYLKTLPLILVWLPASIIYYLKTFPNLSKEANLH